MTLPDAKTLLRPANTPWLPSSKGAPALPHRMLAICDISADPGGSIEFMNECTTIDTPFCLYDADRNKDTKSFKGPGVLVSYKKNVLIRLPHLLFLHDVLLQKCDDKVIFLRCVPRVQNKFFDLIVLTHTTGLLNR